MSEIVPTLFGLSPQAFQQQRQQQADAQALALAQLDPFQRASFGIQSGANRLAGAVGGMLGGQDPELQRRTQAQQIMGTIDPSDPDTFLRAAEMALQGGDQQLALGLRDEHAKRVAASQQAARGILESDALIAQRSAAAQASLAPKAEPTPKEAQLAALVARRAGPEGSAEYDAAFNASLDQQMASKEAKSPAVGTNREAFSSEMYDKPFAELTQAERRAVNERVKNEGGSGQSINVNIQNSKDLNQAQEVIKAATAFDKAIEGPTAQLNTAQNVKTLINQAVRSNNSQAFEASRTTLAKLVGESRLSNEDIARTGIDPRLIAGALDWVSKKFDGVPNEDVMKQMFAVAQALEDSATAAINRQADRQRKIAEAAGFKGNLDDFFPRATPIAAGDTDEAKEARYQAYKRAQEGK